MKPSLFLLLGGTLLAGGAASAYTLQGFKASPAVEIKIPASPDSLSKENPFSPEKLLQMRKAIRQGEFAQDWTTLTPDTAGRMTLSSAAEMPKLSTVTTRIRAQHFAKGKLVLNTPAMADLMVNGKSMAQKTTADSLATDLTAHLNLDPEADYEIQINFLTLPDAKSAPDFKLEFVPEKEYENVAIQSGMEMERRLAPVDIIKGERARSVSLSPDGKYLLTTFSTTLSADDNYRRATLTETATGRVVSEDINPSAQWMESGNTLYYTSNRGDVYDLFTIDIPSMSVKKLASDLPEGRGFVLSPDNRYLFYYTEVEGKKDTGVMRRVQSPDDRIPGNRDRYYISRYDIKEKVSVPLTYGGATTNIVDFTRDGAKMLYMSSRQTPSEYPFYLSSVIEMDMKTLKTDTIIKDNGFVTNALYSPDGKQLFVIGGPEAFGSIGVNAGNHETPNAFDNQGYIYDIASGKVRAMTRDFDPSVETGTIWNRADNKIYFRGETGFYIYLYSLDPVSGKIEKIDTGDMSVYGFSLPEENAKWTAYIGRNFTKDGVACVTDLKTAKQRIVADPFAEQMAGVEFGKMEPWKFKSSFGDVIDGYLCLPPDFDPNKKYPLIVYYYGGTSPSNAAIYHHYSPQIFASRDYVVYVVNPSGTTGYGQEFSARHVNAWGKQTAEEIIEGTKAFCKAHPFVDSKKIGCIGASYGGFMTQYLQTLTDIFACAVSHAGISNVTSYWGEGFWGYSYNSVAAAKHYPWTDPKLFTEQGSLFNADKIHTPLLLLHGTQDTNVPIGESIQIFNALRVLGRDVEFITVEDENHVISNFDRKLLWHETIMAWFAKYLQDDPRWWNNLYN